MASRNRKKQQTVTRSYSASKAASQAAAAPLIGTPAPQPKQPSFVERFEAQAQDISGLRKENEALRSQLTLNGVRITLLTQLIETRLAEILGVEVNLQDEE